MWIEYRRATAQCTALGGKEPWGEELGEKYGFFLGKAQINDYWTLGSIRRRIWGEGEGKELSIFGVQRGL